MRRLGRKPRVAVVGATGAVGVQVLKVLAERDFPATELVALATERSVGRRLSYGEHQITVALATHEALDDVDLAFFCVGSDVSQAMIPQAVDRGVICIDKSSHYRMDPRVPLVVPEVNGRAIRDHDGIIASPNCTTIQLVCALKPLHDAAKITRVTVCSYQAVSGTGREAVHELISQARGFLALLDRAGDEDGAVEDGLPKPEQLGPCSVYPWPIFGNAIPHIDAFGADGYTGEELKLVRETKKILGSEDLGIAATCVRIPVLIGHALVAHVETDRYLCAEKAREFMARAPGLVICDEPGRALYPMPLFAAGRDEVFVGRIREDVSRERGLVMWVVADNLRKGAATNAVQIAEMLLDNEGG